MGQSRPKKIAIWLLLMATMLHTGWSNTIGESKTRYWWQCNQLQPGCNCYTVDGHKQAECINIGLTAIPDTLHAEIQVLRFDDNNIHLLKRDIFHKVGLENLQKILMPNCSVEYVHKDAFAGLQLVTIIDLSNNKIKELDPTTFRHNQRLRAINLNNNLIHRLDDHLFWNLPFLQKVELDDNRIEHISNQAFFELKTLSTVTLKNNRLKTVPATIFNHLDKLSYLELENNPWHCDCHLREFFEYTDTISIPRRTYCAEPEYMRNRSWVTLRAEQFACLPEIVWLDNEVGIDEAKGHKVMLNCRVVGDPEPKTYWTSIQTLSDGSNSERNRNCENGDTTSWCNVTISPLVDEDVYTCVARNEAGQVERKVQVIAPTNESE